MQKLLFLPAVCVALALGLLMPACAQPNTHPHDAPDSGASFSVTADRDTVRLDEPVTLTVTLKNISNFQMPELSDFRVAGMPSSSSSMVFANGRTSSQTTYTYYLLPKHAGKATIDKMTVHNGTKTMTSEKIKLFVVNEYADPRNAASTPTEPRSGKPQNSKPTDRPVIRRDRPVISL